MVETPVLSDRPLKLLILASKPAGVAPSQRFRFEQWTPWLEKEHGVEVEFSSFESERLCDILYRPGHRVRKAAYLLRDFARRTADIAKAKKADAVLLHREAALAGPPIIERRIARSGTPIIFDFDDAIWRPGVARSPLFNWLRAYDKFDELCALSSAVTAGNQYLAVRAARVTDNVHIVPTSIDTDDYVERPESTADDFVVSWTGSLSTLAHFEHARTALEELAKRLPLAVKVICNRPPDQPIAGARNIFVEWSPENEGKHIADCHVGIMPLPDDEFTRGKCGLKALQFMACGRPVVVSPVGVNSDIVEEGVSGYFATDVDEWVERLERLAKDRALRLKMGKAARQRAETSFSARHVAGLFANVLKSVTT